MIGDPTPLSPPRLASGPLAKASLICWTHAKMLRRAPSELVHFREGCIHQLCNAALMTRHEKIKRIAEGALKAIMKAPGASA